MVSVIDTSALFALLDVDDVWHSGAVAYWDAVSVDFVTHTYVVTETVSLARRRLGWPAVTRLIDDVLPTLRIELVDRDLHDHALRAYRSVGKGTSFVDRVTILFARRLGIPHAFAYDPDLVAAGLTFPPLP